MNEIQTAVLSFLPLKRKSTPSGWISFDAVCCHHNGEARDTRKRGGVNITNNGGFQYHCFNCNFKAGWTPGKLLSKNTKSFFKWLGLSDTEIGKLSLFVLNIKDSQPVTKKEIRFDLVEKSLPEDCFPINFWIDNGLEDNDFYAVVDYLLTQRTMKLDWYNFHWTPVAGYRDRIIIPFYHEGKIVGYTGRKIKEGKPKYLTDAQPGYVFNLDRQQDDREYIIVVEGQFDAIAIDGVAVMHNELNDIQIARLRATGKTIIVVPDKDRPGAKLLKSAIDNEWHASLPPWEDDIKDVADAVKRYGRLYALASILHHKIQGNVKIELLKKKLEKMNE